MKRVLLTIVWIVISCSVPAFAANLFPLADGNSWTYRDASTGDTFTVRVGMPSVFNGNVYYSLRGYTPKRLYVRLDEQFNQLVAYDEEGAREVVVTAFQPNGLWWEAPFRICDQEGQAVPTPGVHNGPVGFFEPALDLQYRSFGCADAIEAEQFALNYGLLRRVVHSSAGVRQFDLVSATIGGMSIGTSAPFLVPGSGSFTRITAGEDQSLKAGYGRVQSSASLMPAGFALFGYRQAGILVSEATVPAVPAIRAGRIYAETTGNVRTGLAIANPNAQPVTLTFYFSDENGQNFAFGQTVVGANEQIAGFLDEPRYAGNLPMPITAARTFTFSASEPVAAVALRGFLNERNEFLMTTLPVADLVNPSSNIVVIPEFAEGGGWSTQIVLVNPSESTITGRLRFFDASGVEMETPPYTIAARSSVTVRKDSGDAAIRVGSVQIVPDSHHVAPVGLNIFSFRHVGITVTQTGVPALPPGHAMDVHAEYSQTARSAFTFANPDAAPLTIHFELFFNYGVSTGITGSLVLPANGQKSLFLDELAGLGQLPANFKGLMRVTAPQGEFAMIGLRARDNERGDFLISATTAYPASSETSSEMFVPHFVDGGGYTTEFIFVGRKEEPVNATMYFFSPAGKPMSVTTFK